jgi:hypothetical protein
VRIAVSIEILDGRAKGIHRCRITKERPPKRAAPRIGSLFSVRKRRLKLIGHMAIVEVAMSPHQVCVAILAILIVLFSPALAEEKQKFNKSETLDNSVSKKRDDTVKSQIDKVRKAPTTGAGASDLTITKKPDKSSP